MAVVTGQVAVTSTAAKVVSQTFTDSITSIDHRTVTVVNSGATTVYLGPSGVTTSTGFPLVAGAALSVDFLAPDDLYVIAASTGTVGYLFERI